MLNKGPAIPGALATAILCLLVGGVGGYYARYFQEPERSRGEAPSSPGGMGGMGGMMGGMGGGFGGGQGQPQHGTELARLVRNLSTVEKVQNQSLGASQAQAILPILTALKSAEKLSDKEAEEKIAEINKALSDSQKQALQELQPPFGNRGGGGGGNRTAGSGVPGGPPGGMMGGMGGRPDPERPFASDRNRQALEGLITRLQAPTKN